MTNIQILKRLYKDYTKKYLRNILISVFFTLLLAGSTSSIAYLLDPAINELFIKQSSTLLYIIPICIVIAFAIKGASLYLAKIIMINVSEEVRSHELLKKYSDDGWVIVHDEIITYTGGINNIPRVQKITLRKKIKK